MAYRFNTGSFRLSRELITEGINPLSISPNPFDPAKKIWSFDGTEEVARIAKDFCDRNDYAYSQSLSKLIDRLDLDREDNNDE